VFAAQSCQCRAHVVIHLAEVKNDNRAAEGGVANLLEQLSFGWAIPDAEDAVTAFGLRAVSRHGAAVAADYGVRLQVNPHAVVALLKRNFIGIKAEEIEDLIKFRFAYGLHPP
jgi:hypothetical protein